MTWYSAVAADDAWMYYNCQTKENIRMGRFNSCSYNCDTAIDDNRDLTLQNSSTETVACLKLCMWE